MNMNIELNTTNADKLAIDHLSESMVKLLTAFPENIDLMSPVTGELISKDDIRRVLGILDGLRNNTTWEIVLR